jgi:DNA-binding transcriptional MocR family regulator
LDELKKAVEAGKIDICLLVSNFSNPLGSCIPTENKRAIVELLERHNIPLIEDDLYGDMYFGKQRPLTCKSFDEAGNVLLCSSVSKTLAPGYRVGWVIPGKYKEKVLNTKLYQTISTTTLTQEVIADFMEKGRYEHHLNKMRNALFGNLMQLIRAINLYFPENTKIHRPEGGFMLWVELDENTDTVILFEEALKHKISIAPGRLFTTQELYRNCLRMNYSWLWNERIENAIKILGSLVRKQG